MNEETRNLPIEPDLEARIVALVLGEASDFETEELDRLIKSRPELAAFKHEMEQVSKQLREVGQNELETPDAQWQLSSERRQVVLDVIHGKVTASTIGSGAEVVGKSPRLRRPRWSQVLEAAVAMSILAVVIGLVGLMLPAGRMRRDMSGYLAKAETHLPEGAEASRAVTHKANSSANVDFDSADRTSSFYQDLDLGQTELPIADSRQNSAAALSAIQDSLQRSIETASIEAGANVFSALPQSGSIPDVTPQFTPSQNWSAPGNDNGIALHNTPFTTGVTNDRSGIDPDQADKLIAGFQKQLGEPAGAMPADPHVQVPDGGTIQLGGIKKSAGEALFDFPVLDSIEKQKDSADGKFSDVQVEADDIALLNESRPEIALGSGSSGQLSPQPGEFKGEAQKGQQGLALAENAPVTGFDVQFPDPTIAGNDLWYRNPTNGRDLPGGNIDDFGDSGGTSGRGGGMGGGGGMGSGMDGVVGGLNLGSPVTPRFGVEAGEGMPGGSKRDDGGFEYGQSAGSPSEGKSLELPKKSNNESGESGNAGEQEETLEELNKDGEAARLLESESRKNLAGDKANEDRTEDYLKPQSAEESLKSLSDRQREFESGLTLGGEIDQSERVTELDKEVDGRPIDGIPRGEGRSVTSRGTSGLDSKVANRGELATAQDETKISQFGELLDSSGKRSLRREAPSAGLNETNAATESFSTFSLHVSDVSFKLAAAALARGEWPEAAKIRIEEFVNAFDYGDPLPCANEKVACVVEQAIHPFLQQRNVLRVSMRTSAEGRAASTPLRLTLVLDNSGSMERIDRQQAVQRALLLLAQQLSPNDQVTLISFARQPRLLAESVSGSELGKLVELIGQLPSEGGTNIEAALKLAFEKAASQQTAGAQNRIVLLTDGAVNLGNANPESLSRMVETMRTAGIAFDAAGISADGLNDEILEALTRKGDGRYYLLDGEESSGGRFAQQIAGALRPSASNVKVQVEFNPKRVGQYKLLGFEKHLLQQEDFRNDAVDAAELAAAEAGVALYQFEAKPDGEGDVGTVSVRFRDLATGQMVEQLWPIPYEANALRPDQAASSIRLATAAAMLAARLRGEALGETVDLKSLSDLVAGLSEQQQYDPRVQQLKLMIEQARQLSER